MKTSERGFVHPRLVVGLMIMALGTLFLLDNLNLVDFDDLIRFWPIAPVLLGATLVMQERGSTNRAFGGFLIVAGLWILLDDFGVIDISFWDAWPVFLIGLGGWLVWKGLGPKAEIDRGGAGASASRVDFAPGAPAGPSTQTSANEEISAFAFVGGIERRSTCRSFREADATAIMGGCLIDLRDADIGETPAVVDAFAFWGGIDILVPDNWVVINKVFPLLGNVEDASRPQPGANKEILVRGTALMGGVRIGNEPREERD